ncbi:MAG: MOSC domain-containing protein [Candidatus Latescibacteria bacterium]|nr:MOSC domain-containing protein [bacterium]MBD3425083.1 MOSC domain-containing protein [Candidatus Latescibacterota bacterium]
MKFEIVSVNISGEKGVRKKPVDEISLRPGHGIEGDAHAGDHHRQISLLAMEDIEPVRKKLPDIEPGDFAENITTRGIDLPVIPVGATLRIGEAELEVTQIGKKCHRGCEIMELTGDCVMPRRGIFARVLKGGVINRESTGTYRV